MIWYKDGVPIKEDNRVKCVKVSPDTFELNFQKTTADDNGNWAVIARNQHGEMSQFFAFAALQFPKFETKLSDQEANEGKQVSRSIYLCFMYTRGQKVHHTNYSLFLLCT